MNRFLFIGGTWIALLSCNTTSKVPAAPPAAPAAPVVAAIPVGAPVVTWTQKLADLGEVRKGEKKSTVFEFTNTSGGPLKIYHVDACSCTEVDFPRSVIPAGEKRRLPVTFDSTKKDASETISINVFFEKVPATSEPPMIEVIQYKYTLL